MMKINEIKKLLSNFPIEINYTKLNGTKRNILATRSWKFLKKDSSQHFTEPKHKRKLNDKYYIIVWDLKNKGFRTLIYNHMNNYKKSKYKGKIKL